MDEQKEKEVKLMATFVILVLGGVALMVWATWLVTAVTMMIFVDPVNIPTGTAAAYATLFGLPALIIVGMWKGIQSVRQNLLTKGDDKNEQH